MNVLTPTEFKQKLLDIKENYEHDTEVLHMKLDRAMCDLLASMGYGEAVAVFQSTHLWYT